MKRFIYIIIVIALVLGTWELYDNYMEKKNVEDKPAVSEVVGRVFSVEGINKSECIIEGYYFYGTNYLGEDGSRELLDVIANKLGVNTKYEFIREKTDTGYIAILTKEGADSKLIIKLITVEKEESESVISQKQYLSINLEINNSISSAFYYYNNIAEVMENVISENKDNNENISEENINNNLTISVKGLIKGNISIDEQIRIAKKMLNEFEAKEVFDSINETHDDSKMNMYSLYGYSKSIEDYVAIGKERINLNIVFNYNEENRETIIHIGSPIVNYDY